MRLVCHDRRHHARLLTPIIPSQGRWAKGREGVNFNKEQMCQAEGKLLHLPVIHLRG